MFVLAKFSLWVFVVPWFFINQFYTEVRPTDFQPPRFKQDKAERGHDEMENFFQGVGLVPFENLRSMDSLPSPPFHGSQTWKVYRILFFICTAHSCRPFNRDSSGPASACGFCLPVHRH